MKDGGGTARVTRGVMIVYLFHVSIDCNGFHRGPRGCKMEWRDIEMVGG